MTKQVKEFNTYRGIALCFFALISLSSCAIYYEPPVQNSDNSSFEIDLSYAHPQQGYHIFSIFQEPKICKNMKQIPHDLALNGSSINVKKGLVTIVSGIGVVTNVSYGITTSNCIGVHSFYAENNEHYKLMYLHQKDYCDAKLLQRIDGRFVDKTEQLVKRNKGSPSQVVCSNEIN